MFPMTTKMGGMAMAFPDTCKVPAPPGPPVPTPFPNVTMFLQSNPGTCAQKVRVLGQPVVTAMTVVTMTSGDESGALGGVMSNTMKGPARLSKGSSKVFAMGLPVGHHTCPVDANGVSPNAKGMHSVPSQVKVFVKG